MRVLLTEGSGLTARQCATVLSSAGHEVAALTSDPLCLCRFTRHVRALHRVPNFAADPFRWLDAALDVYRRERFDVLLPTQEQVAVLAAAPDRLREVATAVPSFAALTRVQDKISAHATLREVGLPQPESAVLTNRAELAAWHTFPSYLKTPIGTASGGVRRIDDAQGLADLPADWLTALHDHGLLAQRPVPGRLAMVQSVFAHGRLVAFHANERAREGVRGGASHKRALDLPEGRRLMSQLGEHLDWHGALSADLILGPDGPVIIDINPRLVEPINALRSGVDLVTAMLDISLDHAPRPQPTGVPETQTHQLLLAVLGAAARNRRRAVIGELWAAAGHRESYRDSTEELTPGLLSDPRSAALSAAATAAVLIRPRSWTWFSGGAVTAYALTPQAWSAIIGQAQRQRS